MKRISLFLMGFFATVMLNAQTAADPVIMKINGKNITRSEFEYSFNKNNSDGVIDKKSIEDYVPLFVNFKLKVAEAESQKIDTLTNIRKELDSYKEQMVIPTLVDSAFIEREALNTYNNTASRFEGQDLLTASHILILLSPNATSSQESEAKNRIDSIYNVLKNVDKSQLPAKFAELATEKSDDKGSAQRGGALGQFGKGMMIPDFENAAYALKAGEMSQPFKSTYGYHIIYMTDRHPFESYEFHHDNIIKFLEQRGIREASANAYVDSISKAQNISRREVIDNLLNDVLEKDPESKYLSQEYYDGTLMYEVTKKDVWDVAQQDIAGQEAYFNANKKDYAWDSPRYCGIIIHAKDAATMSSVKKLLKSANEEDYAKVATSLNSDSVKLVRVERGIFKQGDNSNVDNLVFKQKTEIKPMKDYPVTEVYGKVAKAPRSYKDVRGQVTTDYQNSKESAWVEELRKKYPVEIYEDVVKTVNNH